MKNIQTYSRAGSIVASVFITAVACSSTTATNSAGSSGTTNSVTPNVANTSGAGGTSGSAGSTMVMGGAMNAAAGGAGAGGSAGSSEAGGSSGMAITGGAGQGGAAEEPDVAPACAATVGENAANLTVRFPELGTRVVGTVPADDMMRIEHDPVEDKFYLLNQGGQIWTLDIATGNTAEAAIGFPGGDNCRSMTFGPDGALYVQCHGGGGISVNIQKGTPDGNGGFTWSTLVTSEGYPPSNTNFDHAFNGIVVSQDGADVFFASGSRTDHGEVEMNLREVPLTSAIFKVPANSNGLMLENDEAALAPYKFADGVRNAFDIAFNSKGELFAVDNGPDIDLPDEINFIQEGKHYGFPWRFGDIANPVLDPAYTPDGDTRLHGGFQAVDNGTYQYDATFPAAPPAMVDALLNHGPDSDKFRPGAAGQPTDASEMNMMLSGITAHKSPLGLQFDQGTLCDKYYKAGFFVSYGAVQSFFQDAGEDVSLIELIKVGDGYQMSVTQLIAGLENPIDSVLVGNKLYVMEYGLADGRIIEIALPLPAP